MNHQQGFTLIELMIVVAIIGIIASVAIPMYSKYIDKTKVQSGLYEVAASRGQFEVQINDGNTSITLADLGMQASSQNCSALAVNFNAGASEWSLNCTLTGSPIVAGRIIGVIRTSDGKWSCKTDVTGGLAPIPDDIRPTSCT